MNKVNFIRAVSRGGIVAYLVWGMAVWGVTCGSLILLPVSTAQADVLLIDSVSSAQLRDLPRTGQTMDKVRAQWGEPVSEYSPVGQPPITRWDYDGFSVYFEYNHVINSVLDEGAVVSQTSNDGY